VFEVEIRPEILNLVVRAQRAAKRAGTHAAKERGQVLAVAKSLLPKRVQAVRGRL
jgi:LSU ribosomal protein L4P